MQFPWLSENQIEASASRLLQRCVGSSGSSERQIDLEQIVIHLSETEELSYDDDANLGFENGEPILGKTQPLRGRILLSRDLKSDLDTGRARFTLAHELGHWVLHRPLFVARAAELSLFGPTEQVPEVELVGLNRSIFPDGRRKVSSEEWQANRFAVALLINSEALRSEFVTRYDAPIIPRCGGIWQSRSTTLRAHSRLLGAMGVNGYIPLKDVFGLSGEAMAIALESRGYATDDAPLI